MNESELRRYAEMLASMSVDFLAGGITAETYKQNLRLAVKAITKDDDKARATLTA